MVLSYYLYKYPYKLCWNLLNLLHKNPPAMAYCAEPLDYVVLKPVLDHLPGIPIIAKNSKTARYLRQKGLSCRRMPQFPGLVILCRHAAHKFPEDKIIKIGFRHGAYHFKRFAGTKYYNFFDCYFVTSHREQELARARGIKTAVALGFPKLDPLFDGSYPPEKLDQYRQQAKIDPTKKTILFTATWDKSGMSAIHLWIDKIGQLLDKYNVIVTVHPWTSKKYVRKLKSDRDIFFIDDPEIAPYLLLADVLVGDTSSIIAEFCVLDKPIITFKVPATGRTDPEAIQLLRQISITIEKFEELEPAICSSLQHPTQKSASRQQIQTKFMAKSNSKPTG